MQYVRMVLANSESEVEEIFESMPGQEAKLGYDKLYSFKAALLYTVIISISTLLQNINVAIFYHGTIDNKISWFLQRNTLWIIIMVAIIIILSQ